MMNDVTARQDAGRVGDSMCWVRIREVQAVCVTRFDQSERVICVGIFALGKSRFEKCMR